MPPAPGTHALIAAVAVRAWAVRFTAIAGRALAITAVLSLALVVAARLTGLHTVWTGWTILALPVVVALAAGLAMARRPAAKDVARLVDARLGGVDLFTTAIALDGAPGAYQEIVRQQAEAAAGKADPRVLHPFTPGPLLQRGALALAALALVVAFVPVLDPFGAQASRERFAQRQRLLEQQKTAARERVAALQDDKPGEPVSAAVARELARLTATFDALKPGEPQLNKPVLLNEQKALAKALADRQAEAFKPADAEQMLGGDMQTAKALAEALAKGEDRKIQAEMEALRQQAEDLAKATDPVTAEQQRRDLQRRLEAMQQALGRRGQAAGRTVQQALDQLAQAGDQRMRDQALDALESSLEQLGMELQCLGREARDVEALKQALNACRMARQLDDQGKLPGDCKGCSLAEYAKRYAACMKAGAGRDGQSPTGMGANLGRGQGGKANENDQAQTDFTPEKSPSQLTAGQTILQWKTKGPSESGVAEERYRQAVQQARQEATEALTQEDLPPSYQETVKIYFDGLGK